MDFFLNKIEVYKQKIVLNEYEICFKMLEMAILETQIFKSSHLWPLLCFPLFKVQDLLENNITGPAILQPWHLCNSSGSHKKKQVWGKNTAVLKQNPKFCNMSNLSFSQLLFFYKNILY